MRTWPSAVKAAADAAGSRQYLAITAGERRQIAPTSPARDGEVVVVEEREVDGRMRTADAHDRVLGRVVEPGAEADAGLGARVPRGQRGAEPGACLVGQARGDGPSSHGDEPHRRQVVVVEVGLTQHERELGRDTGDARHPVLGDKAQRVRARSNAR